MIGVGDVDHAVIWSMLRAYVSLSHQVLKCKTKKSQSLCAMCRAVDIDCLAEALLEKKRPKTPFTNEMLYLLVNPKS